MQLKLPFSAAKVIQQRTNLRRRRRRGDLLMKPLIEKSIQLTQGLRAQEESIRGSPQIFERIGIGIGGHGIAAGKVYPRDQPRLQRRRPNRTRRQANSGGDK